MERSAASASSRASRTRSSESFTGMLMVAFYCRGGRRWSRAGEAPAERPAWAPALRRDARQDVLQVHEVGRLGEMHVEPGRQGALFVLGLAVAGEGDEV